MNRERKNMFLSEVVETRSRGRASSLLDYVGSREEKVGADVAEFSLPVVESTIDDSAVWFSDSFDVDSNSAYVFCAKILYQYNYWCRKQGFQANPNITRCRFVKIAKAAEWVLPSPAELQRIMNVALLPEAARPTDLFCRGVVWLAYAGVDIEKIVDVEDDDFDKEKMAVRTEVAGKTVNLKLPEESRVSMILLSSLDELIYYGDVMKGPTKVRRKDGKSLTRTQPTRTNVERWEKKNKKTFVRNTISKLHSDDGLSITYDTLYKNGYYYRAWLTERKMPASDQMLTTMTEVAGGNFRMGYKYSIKDLDEMVNRAVYRSGDRTDPKRIHQHWKQKIYNEYALWKWVAHPK